MTRVVRKRGFFGWLFLILFWVVNIWFAYAFVHGMSNVSATYDPTHHKTAQDIGIAVGITMLLTMWGFAAVITGLLAFFTRGKAVIVDDLPPVSFAKMRGPVTPDEFVKRAKATRSPFAYVGMAFGLGAALIAGFALVWLIS